MASRSNRKALDDVKLYTMGWICALAIELAAATMMLDEKHNPPRNLSKTVNHYSCTWGKINDHNVVIISLPEGMYGKVAAASTANALRASLPHLRFGLLVGIGAGIRAKRDILLGDVAVSKPDGANSGVVQYDLVKSKTIGTSSVIESKGFLNSPPIALLSALSQLKAAHEMGDSEFEDFTQVFQGKEQTKAYGNFPGLEKDHVRQQIHKEDSDVRVRPKVHYGTIISGDILQKNSHERDALVARLEKENVDPICLEMEAAGLMNTIPCLVIRGISDYADESKDDVWQRYAAGMAAAFAKELLHHLDAEKIDNSTQIGDLLDLNRQKMDKISSALEELTFGVHFQGTLRTAKGAAWNSVTDDGQTCLEGTCKDLLCQIMEWANNKSGRRILWLNGMAGTGKSTISRTIARDLDQQERLGASFFFKRGESDRSDGSHFFPTIAIQLAKIVPGLAQLIMEAHTKDSSLDYKSLHEQFNQLLFLPLTRLAQGSHLKPVFLVIDAMDECESKSKPHIREIISLLSKLDDIETLDVRIFATSRPEYSVLEGFRGIQDELHLDIQLEEVQQQTVEKDIRKYFEHRFKEIAAEYELKRSWDPLPKDWPGKEKIDTLVRFAVPLFIVAFTVCKFVGDSKPQKALEEILENAATTPLTGLGKLYTSILNQLIRDQPKSRQYQTIAEFQALVGAVILLADPLSARSLHLLLGIGLGDIQEQLSLLTSVLSIPNTADVPIRLFHQSFRDYLLHPSIDEQHKFSIDEQQTHYNLAKKCLEMLSKPGVLREDVCDVHMPGTRRTEISQEIIDLAILPHVAYACRHWVFHLSQSKGNMDDYDQAFRFLEHNFLYWIEAMSWLGELSKVIKDLVLLQSILKKQTRSPLMAFLQDARRFMLQNRYIIDIAPLQLYSSVLIFTPVQSVVRGTFYYKHCDNWSLSLPMASINWSSEIQKLEGHGRGVYTMVFSPDEQVLASASGDKTIKIWDAATSELIHTVLGHDKPINSVAFSPNGHLLASASDDRTTKLWNSATLELVHTLFGHDDPVNSVAFSLDGRILASASDDKTIKIWSATTFELIHTLSGHDRPINSVTFSIKILASASNDRTVKLWNAVTGETIHTFWGHDGPVNGIAFSLQGQILASASDDRTIKLWNVTTREILKTFRGHDDHVKAIAFSYDGEVLASGSRDRTVRLWNTATGEAIETLKGHSGVVYAIAFSHSRKLLASASNDTTVRLWNFGNEELIWKREGHKSGIHTIVFSHSKQVLASAAYDTTVKLWSVPTGKVIQTLTGHDDVVYTIEFSCDGQMLASASSDRTVRLWSTTSGDLIQIFGDNSNYCTAITFSPNGEFLALASSDNAVQLWSVATGKLILRLTGHEDVVYTLAISSNGQILASASADKTIRLWSTMTGNMIRTPNSVDSRVNALAFSHGGRMLALATNDQIVQLWDLTTIQKDQHIKADNDVHQMAFTENDLSLMTNVGVFDLGLQDHSPKDDISISLVSPSIVSLNDQWLQYKNHPYIWLPLEYRGRCSATDFGHVLAVGQPSGDVSIFRDRYAEILS